MCTREIISLPWLWEGGKRCTYRSMRRKKSLQVLWVHVVQRHALLCLQDSHTRLCMKQMRGQMQLFLHTHTHSDIYSVIPCTCRDGKSHHDVGVHLYMSQQLNKRSRKQIWSQWFIPVDMTIILQTLSVALFVHIAAECKYEASGSLLTMHIHNLYVPRLEHNPTAVRRDSNV